MGDLSSIKSCYTETIYLVGDSHLFEKRSIIYNQPNVTGNQNRENKEWRERQEYWVWHLR
jgi:hypothetical protein